jgi:hypothetical protein
MIRFDAEWLSNQRGRRSIKGSEITRCLSLWTWETTSCLLTATS